MRKDRRWCHLCCLPLSLSPLSSFSSSLQTNSILKCIITPSLLCFHLSSPSIPLFFSLTSFTFISPPPLLSVEGQSAVITGIINCHCAARKTRTQTEEDGKTVKGTFRCKQKNNSVFCYSPWHLLYPPHTQSLTPSICFHFFCHIWILKRSERDYRNAVKEQKTQTRDSCD